MKCSGKVFSSFFHGNHATEQCERVDVNAHGARFIVFVGQRDEPATPFTPDTNLFINGGLDLPFFLL